MVLDMLRDCTLQGQCAIIPIVASPLERMYGRDLKLMTQGPASQQLFAANRSGLSQHSFATAMEVLHAAHSDMLMHRLGMAPPVQAGGMANEAGDFPLRNEGWAGLEAKLLDVAHEFGCALASELIWTHAHYHWCFPFSVAVYLTPDVDERHRLCRHLSEVAEAIAHAESITEPPAMLEECLWDVSWNREQLPRALIQHGLSTSFDPDDTNMRKFVGRLFASSSSTKELLESNFNNMSRQMNYMNTNCKASDAMRWLMATTSPYVEAGGAKQILPKEPDWFDVLSSPQGRKIVQKMAPKFFSANSTPMPAKVHDDDEPFATPAELQKLKFRAAGNPALNRSAAATAYLVSERRQGFTNVDNCWAGQ